MTTLAALARTPGRCRKLLPGRTPVMAFVWETAQFSPGVAGQQPSAPGNAGRPRRPGAVAVDEPQLEPRTSRLPLLGGPHHRHHTQDDPEPGNLQRQDTPNEQDSMTKRKISCQRNFRWHRV
jgi:hypothetical protein